MTAFVREVFVLACFIYDDIHILLVFEFEGTSSYYSITVPPLYAGCLGLGKSAKNLDRFNLGGDEVTPASPFFRSLFC